MVYGVFYDTGEDWGIDGYFDNRQDADKYCLELNDTDYYVDEIKDLKNKIDLSKITLKYEHIIVFMFSTSKNEWVIREECELSQYYRYNCYKDNILRQNHIKLTFNSIDIYINLHKYDRKLAEKIAQDYLAKLIYYSENKIISKESVELMNNKIKNNLV